jgi:hypothetical protein
MIKAKLPVHCVIQNPFINLSIHKGQNYAVSMPFIYFHFFKKTKKVNHFTMKTNPFIPAVIAYFLLCFSAPSQSQQNVIKANLFSLPLKNVSLQYERKIISRTSAALGVRWQPSGSLPLESALKNLADDPEVERQIDNLTTGNFTVTPEVRFYLGKKKSMRGIYIAPHLRYARFTADLPFEYDDGGVTKTIPMSGSLNTITGGLLLGSQFSLGKLVYLDWWILGPAYGRSSGDISGKKTLSPSEQQSLRDELATLDVPLTKISYTVDANGATVYFKGPWAGIRTGLCLGFRF